MKITENKPSESTIELLIELDRADIETDLQKTAKKISESLDIAGFRKGTAPYDVVCRTIGGEEKVYEDALQSIVQRTAGKAVEEKNMDFFGQPKIAIKKMTPPFGITYQVTLALMPSVELGDPTKITEKRKKVEVADADADKVLDELRTMRATEAAVERPAQQDDKVVVAFEVKREGVTIDQGKSDNYPLVLGEKKFIPGFEEQVVGMKVGEVKEFELTFPKEYFEKSLAGKPAQFTVTLKQVFERKLPELNDAFATEVGAKDLADLRSQIKENMKHEKEREEEERFQMACMDALVKLSNIGTLPESAVHEETHKMIHEVQDNITRQGGKFEDYLASIKKSKEDLEKEFVPKAEERLKIGLVARAFNTEHKIEVSDEEFNKEYERTKQQYAQNPEMQAQVASEEYKSYLRNALASKKVFTELTNMVEKK